MFGCSLKWSRFWSWYIRGGDMPQPPRSEPGLKEMLECAKRNRRKPLVYGPYDLIED